jgi:hypothetical protein
LNNTEKLTLAAPEVSSEEPNNFNLTVMNAINGKVIQIRTYHPQQRGPDWKTEYYVVPEGERLTDAVTILLMAKNLEKAQ